MGQKIFGSLLIVGVIASNVWAQDAAKPEAQDGNWLAWILLMVPMFGFLWIVLVLNRSRKTYKVDANRSLQLLEEHNELARKQVALQEQTNRLLERLIAEPREK